VSGLALSLVAAIAEEPGVDPLEALRAAWQDRRRTTTPDDDPPPPAHADERVQPSVVDPRHPSLLLLRRAKAASKQPPLVIAHGLLGDHRGYGRLWSGALETCDVYALRNRGLDGSEAFALDPAGAAAMVSEYAAALVAVFAETPFDLLGASFGAVLAQHVANAAREKGHLRVEMGADVWTRFPQLRSLPEGALPHFIAAQLVPAGASSEQDLTRRWSCSLSGCCPCTASAATRCTCSPPTPSPSPPAAAESRRC